MVDPLTPEQRSRAMKSVKLRDGPLERLVQYELRARGLKFRRHVHNLPGRPDIVFAREKVAIFVDGDFWHGYRLPLWERKLSQFWREKLRANRKRDRRNFQKLRARNWTVVRIWEHQLELNARSCVERILRALSESNGAGTSPSKSSPRTGRGNFSMRS
jgi:DNA mismatch endonuclease, patch repair protein